MTSSDVWGAEDAERYDADSAEMFRPDVLEPAVEFLADLAGEGPVLEFAIGTGRVALPLAARGIAVSGVELSEPMVGKLREKPGGNAIPVVVGDMASSWVGGDFSLVYVVWNSLSNLREQDEQVRCFANAARQLRPGGRFVVELWVPDPRRRQAGEPATCVAFDARHVVIDEYDTATQACASHHYWRHDDGGVRYGVGRFRYAWPAELDLMARLAGLSLEARHAGWDRAPFDSSSTGHVSVWRKGDEAPA